MSQIAKPRCQQRLRAIEKFKGVEVVRCRKKATVEVQSTKDIKLHLCKDCAKGYQVAG